jgi:hypothetical protein
MGGSAGHARGPTADAVAALAPPGDTAAPARPSEGDAGAEGAPMPAFGYLAEM